MFKVGNYCCLKAVAFNANDLFCVEDSHVQFR